MDNRAYTQPDYSNQYPNYPSSATTYPHYHNGNQTVYDNAQLPQYDAFQGNDFSYGITTQSNGYTPQGYDNNLASEQPYPPPAYGDATPGQSNPAATEIPLHNVAPSNNRVSPRPSESTQGTFYEDDDYGTSFSNQNIRRSFIKKVFAILSIQLGVTFGFVCFFVFHEPTKEWVQQNGWVYWVSYAVFFVTYITLVCVPSLRRTWPRNIICLSVFTLAFTYMVATISSFYDTTIVVIALGITVLVCASIMGFAMQTKYDFTMCGGLLFALCMVVFFFGLSLSISYWITGSTSSFLYNVYGALAALLFSLFLAYDTQLVMGGHRIALSEEEYIMGALQLYIDIVYIFIIILSFCGKK